MREDLAVGQRVLKYTIEAGGRVVARGGAIGRKRIVLLPQPLRVAAATPLRLVVERALAPPAILFFGAFRPCADAAAPGRVYV